MRNKILLLLLFFTNAFVFPQSNIKDFQRQLDILLANDFFNGATASVNIYDLTADTSLYQLNQRKLLNPASNQKILTSTAALIYLDTTYQFTTKLNYKGELNRTSINGDLYVVGGFDPLFSTNDLSFFIKGLKMLGINEITGDICADVSMKDSLFWGNGWMWDDDPSSDAPYLSALNINENCVDINVINTNAGVKPIVIVKPRTKFISLINNAVCEDNVDSSDFNVTRDWINRVNNIYVNGTIEAKSSMPDTIETKVNIFNPPMYFLTLFKEALQSAGIKLDGSLRINDSPKSAKNLFTFYRPIDTVILNMNKVSDNLSAEMLLYALANKYFGKPASAKKGAQLIDSLISLVGLNPQNYNIADGSGVSRYNLVSTELILDVLKYIYTKPPLFQKLFNSFPISGFDGTLKNRMKNSSAKRNIHAKTGTLSGVSCLSGYALSKNGDLLAFSIMIENYVGDNSLARYFIDEMCKTMSDY